MGDGDEDARRLAAVIAEAESVHAREELDDLETQRRTLEARIQREHQERLAGLEQAVRASLAEIESKEQSVRTALRQLESGVSSALADLRSEDSRVRGASNYYSLRRQLDDMERDLNRQAAEGRRRLNEQLSAAAEARQAVNTQRSQVQATIQAQHQTHLRELEQSLVQARARAQRSGASFRQQLERAATLLAQMGKGSWAGSFVSAVPSTVSQPSTSLAVVVRARTQAKMAEIFNGPDVPRAFQTLIERELDYLQQQVFRREWAELQNVTMLSVDKILELALRDGTAIAAAAAAAVGEQAAGTSLGAEIRVRPVLFSGLLYNLARTIPAGQATPEWFWLEAGLFGLVRYASSDDVLDLEGSTVNDQLAPLAIALIAGAVRRRLLHDGATSKLWWRHIALMEDVVDALLLYMSTIEKRPDRPDANVYRDVLDLLCTFAPAPPPPLIEGATPGIVWSSWCAAAAGGVTTCICEADERPDAPPPPRAPAPAPALAAAAAAIKPRKLFLFRVFDDGPDAAACRSLSKHTLGVDLVVDVHLPEVLAQVVLVGDVTTERADGDAAETTVRLVPFRTRAGKTVFRALAPGRSRLDWSTLAVYSLMPLPVSLTLVRVHVLLGIRGSPPVLA